MPTKNRKQSCWWRVSRVFPYTWSCFFFVLAVYYLSKGFKARLESSWSNYRLKMSFRQLRSCRCEVSWYISFGFGVFSVCHLKKWVNPQIQGVLAYSLIIRETQLCPGSGWSVALVIAQALGSTVWVRRGEEGNVTEAMVEKHLTLPAAKLQGTLNIFPEQRCQACSHRLHAQKSLKLDCLGM